MSENHESPVADEPESTGAAPESSAYVEQPPGQQSADAGSHRSGVDAPYGDAWQRHSVPVPHTGHAPRPQGAGGTPAPDAYRGPGAYRGAGSSAAGSAYPGHGAYPSHGPYQGAGGYSAPGAAQNPGGYPSPGGYPAPGGYAAPDAYPAPGNYAAPGAYPPAGGHPGYGSQPMYSSYPYGGYRAAPWNLMAILSIVFAFVFYPAGIVLGHVALTQIRRTGEQGRVLAIIGLVVGYLALLWTIVVIVTVVALIPSSPQFSGGGPNALLGLPL